MRLSDGTITAKCHFKISYAINGKNYSSKSFLFWNLVRGEMMDEEESHEFNEHRGRTMGGCC